MGSTVINGYTYPEATDQPVTPTDLRRALEEVARGGIMFFASSAARTTAFATLGISPSAGMMSYLINVGRHELYDGAAWKPTAGTVIGEYIQTTVHSIPNNTITAVQLNGTDILDLYSAHDPVTNNSRFTAPFGGRFTFGGGIGYDNNGTGVRDIFWYKTGIVVPGGQVQIATAGLTSVPARTISIDMVAGDYVELVAFHTAGVALNTSIVNNDHPRMSVTYAGG